MLCSNELCVALDLAKQAAEGCRHVAQAGYLAHSGDSSITIVMRVVSPSGSGRDVMVKARLEEPAGNPPSLSVRNGLGLVPE